MTVALVTWQVWQGTVLPWESDGADPSGNHGDYLSATTLWSAYARAHTALSKTF